MDTPSASDIVVMRTALVEAQREATAAQYKAQLAEERANIVEADLANTKAQNSDMAARIALLEL